MSKKTKADCIREVENWSTYENAHKLDHPLYNSKLVKEQLPILSPKINYVLQKIAALDERDEKKDGKKYKHLIFSDLKTNGGAKSIASAFIANGFHLVYTPDLQLKEPIPSHPNNFALLTSTKLYAKDVGIRFRRKVLEHFNKRPDNIYGEQIRFLILDAGFKEGIDVFDIRYIHILETPITYADEKQVIGRGTRFCGQKGLQFIKERGWPLYVFKYRTSIPDSVKDTLKVDYLYDLFLRYSNLDPSLLTFAKTLEDVAIQSSVDLNLNKNLHMANLHFKDLYEDVHEQYSMEFKPEKVYSIKYGKKLEKFGTFNCNNGCKGKLIAMPVQFMLMVWYLDKHSKLINEKRPKPYLCNQIMNSKNYCERLKKAWIQPDLFIIKKESQILDALERLPEKEPYIQQKEDILTYVQNRLKTVQLPPETPKTEMDYKEMQGFIHKHFKQQVWTKPKVENLCVEKEKKDSDQKALLEFTPSQDFIRYYFQPESIYKGLLLWHSTGSGKTCSAIATATSSFEKEGYTILWVTRNTLRGDVWKNMFDQVCSVVLRESMPKEFSLENAYKKPLAYLSDRWMMPITYKQFSNLLLKRNQIYTEMVKRNGAADPLKKTLIIIDEAHKLLSADLNPQERPDFKVLQQFIQQSYDISKDQSVRLLLMSATPYTNDPMHFIKLLNLLKPSNKIPEVFDEFKSQYLDESGKFKQTDALIQQLSGYISYLNREQDVRQFALPELTTIDVPMSTSDFKQRKKELEKHQSLIQLGLEVVAKNKDAIKQAKTKIKEEKKELAEKCKRIKNRVEKAKCKAELEIKVEGFKNYLFNEANEKIKESEEKVKQLKPKLKKLQSELKNYKDNDVSQERILQEKCFKSKQE